MKWNTEKEISLSTRLFIQEPQKKVSVRPGLENFYYHSLSQEIAAFEAQKEGSSSPFTFMLLQRETFI